MGATANSGNIFGFGSALGYTRLLARRPTDGATSGEVDVAGRRDGVVLVVSVICIGETNQIVGRFVVSQTKTVVRGAAKILEYTLTCFKLV